MSKNTGKLWGLICLVPFGWIIIMASLISRKNDVTKRGTLSAEVALNIIRNYMLSYWIIFAIVMAACFASFASPNGNYMCPNILSLVVAPITYVVVKGKIEDFQEEKRTKRRKTNTKK